MVPFAVLHVVPRLFPVLGDREPLHVFFCVRSAADQGYQVVNLVTGAGPAPQARAGAGRFPLESKDLRLAALDRLRGGWQCDRETRPDKPSWHLITDSESELCPRHVGWCSGSAVIVGKQALAWVG